MTYDEEALSLATARGWDRVAHAAALEAGDEDRIALTHPFNWLTEGEVELFNPLVVEGSVE